METKTLYFINASYSEEDKEYSSSIYKLIRIGQKKLKYGWISIRDNMWSGIGTCTDDKFFKNSEIEAIISILGYRDEEFILRECILEEALEIEKILLSNLKEKYEK